MLIISNIGEKRIIKLEDILYIYNYRGHAKLYSSATKVIPIYADYKNFNLLIEWSIKEKIDIVGRLPKGKYTSIEKRLKEFFKSSFIKYKKENVITYKEYKNYCLVLFYDKSLLVGMEFCIVVKKKKKKYQMLVVKAIDLEEDFQDSIEDKDKRRSLEERIKLDWRTLWEEKDIK